MAEQKKSVVKEADYTIDRNTNAKKKSQKDYYSIKIMFENGDWGYYFTKDENDTTYKVGTEASYYYKQQDPKKEGDSMWFIIEDPNRKKNPPQTPKVFSHCKSLPEIKCETRVPLAGMIMTGVVGGKIERKEVREWFDEFVSMVDDSLDGIKW